FLRHTTYTGRSTAGRFPHGDRPDRPCEGGTWMTSTVPALGTRTAEGSALQAVLLDMDGTLVDTEGFWWDVECEVFASLGHTLDESWRHVVVGGPMTRSAGFLIEATGADISL